MTSTTKSPAHTTAGHVFQTSCNSRLKTLEQRLERLEKGQAQIKILLQKALGNLAHSKEWGSYEQARMILNRSKSWYKETRNGEGYEKGSKVNVFLTEGLDWRKVGSGIEYYLPSIEQLKERLIKKA